MVQEKNKKSKVLLMLGAAAPYRLPVLEKLNEKFNLEVFFCKRKTEHRKWNVDFKDFSFKKQFLKRFNLFTFWINYSLPLKLLKEKHDVYISSETPPTLFTTLTIFLFAKLFGKPFVLMEGALETEWYGKTHEENRIKKILKGIVLGIERFFREKLIYPFTDCFIAHSEKTKEFLTNKGVREDKIFIEGLIMPKSQLPKPKVNKGNSKFKEKFVILSLSYLRKRKGIEYLIRAFRKAKLPESILIIAGTGRYEERLKKIAGDSENIRFPGYVEKRENYYSIADVFVLPTLHDPWGLVINEAMYYGLPVITTSAAGAAELVEEEECGMIVEPKNEELLKKALIKIYKDKKMRRKMAKNSKNCSRNYELESGGRGFKKAIKYVEG